MDRKGEKDVEALAAESASSVIILPGEIGNEQAVRNLLQTEYCKAWRGCERAHGIN